MPIKKMKAYASFEDWKSDQTTNHQKLINLLTKLVETTAPNLTKTVKWGQGCWTFDNTPKIYIHAEPDHLHFGFYSGSTLIDPEKVLVGKGKHVRHLKVYTAKDIAPKTISAFIKQIV